MRLPIRQVLGRCAGDEAGVTAVEFAFVAPVLLVLLLGVFDFGHAIYAQSVLQGAVHQAGRNSGLESGENLAAAIDEHVRSQIGSIVPQGSLQTSRMTYKSFNDVGKPEDFVDANANSIYDENECFTDLNGNQHWDEDRGIAGLGGADDVVMYTTTLEYDRITPVNMIFGGNNRRTVSATTVLRNQPFGEQAEWPEEHICPE